MKNKVFLLYIIEKQIFNLQDEKRQFISIKSDLINTQMALKTEVNEYQGRMKILEKEIQPLKEKLEYYKNDDQFQRFVEIRKEVKTLKAQISKLEKEKKEYLKRQSIKKTDI